MTDRARIATALVSLRVGVFIVMFIWTLDKLVNATHASRVLETFYGLGGFGPAAIAAIGVAELALLLTFIAGFQQRIS